MIKDMIFLNKMSQVKEITSDQLFPLSEVDTHHATVYSIH